MGGHGPVHRASGAARACVVLLTLAIAVAIPAVAGAATSQTGLVAVGAAPSLQGGTLAGAVAPSTVVQAEVVLQPRDPAALGAFATAVSTPGSPEYHQFLTPGQFGEEFGATPSTVRAVDAALLAQGLQPGPVSANDLSIPVTVTAASADNGFHVSLQRVQLPDGHVGFANTGAPQLPAGVAGVVQGVLGLSDLPAVSAAVIAAPTNAHVPTRPVQRRDARSLTVAQAAGARTIGVVARVAGSGGGPTACPAASAETMPRQGASIDGYTSDQIAAAYGADPLYGAGDLGATPPPSSKPITIALAEFGSDPDLTTEVATFEQCYAINTAVSTQTVDGGPQTDASDEVALDVDNIIGVAPQANLVIYNGLNTDGGAYDTYNQIIGGDTAEILSTSWGMCEVETDPGVIDMEAPLFQEAAAQGQTVLAASGDSGSEDCEDSDEFDNQLAVDDPGSQPFVTDVGGTSIISIATPPVEQAWNDVYGAGGGGVSSGWPAADDSPENGWAMPAYQSSSTVAGIIEPPYTSDLCGTSAQQPCREVPDVSADADLPGGYVVYWSEHNPSWTILGGTSGAAPTWAALIALIDATPACSASGGVGFLNPRLYQIAAAADAADALNDITIGNNDWGKANNGWYPAASGYDMATGLGTPDAGSETGTGLAAQLCEPTISSITPNSGAATGGYTVTITGSGFAPTSTVTFGPTPATTVTVLSTTQLTTTVPPGNGTVNVSISNAAGTNAPSTTSTFTYPSSTTSSTTTTTSTTSSTVTTTSSTTIATVDTTTSAASSNVVSTATTSHVTSTTHHTGTAASTPTLRLALRQHRYSIAIGTVFCPKACTVGATAAAKVKVTQVKHGRKVTKVESLGLGRVSTQIRAGTLRSLSLTLSPAGVAALRNNSPLSAAVAAQLRSTAGNRSAVGRLALLRPRG